MLILKIIGWLFFLFPFLGFAAFSIWMIRETMQDDENIIAFVYLLFVIWLIGAGILVLTYFTDFIA